MVGHFSSNTDFDHTNDPSRHILGPHDALRNALWINQVSFQRKNGETNEKPIA
jgi:hypothetical protein